MRLFVALQLPQPVRDQLVELARRSKGNLPAARWVPAENLHLTLRFLGEVGTEELDGVGSALEEAVEGRQALDLELGEVGYFARRGRPRVLWVGLGPDQALLDLQAAVSCRLEESVGLDAEPRPFHPHLTLARCRRGWKRSDGERWRRTEFDGVGLRFEVTYVDLMESHLAPSGATHRRVDRYSLDPRS